MKKLFLIILIITGVLSSCTPKKKGFECGTHLLSEKESIDSKITKLETIGVADTTVAFLSGQVMGISTRNDSIVLDTLMHSAIGYKHSEKATYVAGVMSEINGVYKIALEPGIYDLKIIYVGYNALILKNISLSIGEMKELNVVLGQGHGTNNYRITENNKIISE